MVTAPSEGRVMRLMSRRARRWWANVAVSSARGSATAVVGATGVEKEGHMPWRVRPGTIAERAHSFLAQVLFPPDAQKPGVQLRASSHRSNGVPPLMGSSHPECDSAPASGQSESPEGFDTTLAAAEMASFDSPAAPACVRERGVGARKGCHEEVVEVARLAGGGRKQRKRRHAVWK